MAKFWAWTFAISFLTCGLGSWLAPKYLTWYATPPVSFGINCTDSMVWVMNRLLIIQGVCALLGALLVFLFYFKSLLRQRNKSKKQTQTQTQNQN